MALGISSKQRMDYKRLNVSRLSTHHADVKTLGAADCEHYWKPGAAELEDLRCDRCSSLTHQFRGLYEGGSPALLRLSVFALRGTSALLLVGDLKKSSDHSLDSGFIPCRGPPWIPLCLVKRTLSTLLRFLLDHLSFWDSCHVLIFVIAFLIPDTSCSSLRFLHPTLPSCRLLLLLFGHVYIQYTCPLFSSLPTYLVSLQSISLCFRKVHL
ncbi:hypothetical protein AMECASPLE_034927 [Ameca splendens]|uniref:Uncharacterized protein n=1 Tax=Ameca splendens TaxID=208324 RepID=A0ABV1A3G3_9TELE